jgi:hypothetical protein
MHPIFVLKNGCDSYNKATINNHVLHQQLEKRTTAVQSVQEEHKITSSPHSASPSVSAVSASKVTHPPPPQLVESILGLLNASTTITSDLH